MCARRGEIETACAFNKLRWPVRWVSLFIVPAPSVIPTLARIRRPGVLKHGSSAFVRPFHLPTECRNFKPDAQVMAQQL